MLGDFHVNRYVEDSPSKLSIISLSSGKFYGIIPTLENSFDADTSLETYTEYDTLVKKVAELYSIWDELNLFNGEEEIIKSVENMEF